MAAGRLGGVEAGRSLQGCRTGSQSAVAKRIGLSHFLLDIQKLCIRSLLSSLLLLLLFFLFRIYLSSLSLQFCFSRIDLGILASKSGRTTCDVWIEWVLLGH
jgi:hypothetical protein